ncbi:hypothetical protein [Mesorhizobium sp.]|jgi:hypothetical protein|nr:hypothetical protein [Mesorhizobium sp.]
MKLGNPTSTAEAAAKGRQMSIEEADRFAQTVLQSPNWVLYSAIA